MEHRFLLYNSLYKKKVRILFKNIHSARIYAKERDADN